MTFFGKEMYTSTVPHRQKWHEVLKPIRVRDVAVTTTFQSLTDDGSCGIYLLGDKIFFFFFCSLEMSRDRRKLLGDNYQLSSYHTAT